MNPSPILWIVARCLAEHPKSPLGKEQSLAVTDEQVKIQDEEQVKDQDVEQVQDQDEEQVQDQDEEQVKSCWNMSTQRNQLCVEDEDT